MAALPVYGKGALTSGASLLIAFASMLQVAFQVLDKTQDFLWQHDAET